MLPFIATTPANPAIQEYSLLGNVLELPAMRSAGTARWFSTVRTIEMTYDLFETDEGRSGV
jgi:hypothetical protein